MDGGLAGTRGEEGWKAEEPRRGLDSQEGLSAEVWTPGDITCLPLGRGRCPSSAQWEPVLGSVSASREGRKHSMPRTESLGPWPWGPRSCVQLERTVPPRAAPALPGPWNRNRLLLGLQL